MNVSHLVAVVRAGVVFVNGKLAAWTKEQALRQLPVAKPQPGQEIARAA